MYGLGFGNMHEDFTLFLAEQPMFYFLMGYYLAHRFPWERFKRKHLAWLTAGACVSVGLTALYWGGTGQQDTCLLSIPVFAVYVWIHQLTQRYPPSEKAAQVIATLGGCVFGTYLLEGILRGLLVGVYDALAPSIHVLPACCIWVLLVVLCGLGLTWCLKKLPGLRQLL
jgi:peptidoglycan/LPS O-acetylase OafA/YrhL